MTREQAREILAGITPANADLVMKARIEWDQPGGFQDQDRAKQVPTDPNTLAQSRAEANQWGNQSDPDSNITMNQMRAVRIQLATEGGIQFGPEGIGVVNRRNLDRATRQPTVDPLTDAVPNLHDSTQVQWLTPLEMVVTLTAAGGAGFEFGGGNTTSSTPGTVNLGKFWREWVNTRGDWTARRALMRRYWIWTEVQAQHWEASVPEIQAYIPEPPAHINTGTI